MVFGINLIELMPQSFSYAWLGLIIPLIPMMFGWGACKLYTFVEKNISRQKYRNIILASAIILIITCLFLPISKNIRGDLVNIFFSLALCAVSIFSLIFGEESKTENRI